MENNHSIIFFNMIYIIHKSLLSRSAFCFFFADIDISQPTYYLLSPEIYEHKRLLTAKRWNVQIFLAQNFNRQKKAYK